MGDLFFIFLYLVVPLLIIPFLTFRKIPITKTVILFATGIPLFYFVIIALGRFYIYHYDKFFQIHINFWGANFLEIVFFVLALTLVFLYLVNFTEKRGIKLIIITLLLIAPFLFNSIEHGTQNSAVDEGNTVYEAAILDNTQLEHWRKSAYRFTGVVIGSIFTIIHETRYANHPGMYYVDLSYYKALHWLFSIILVLGLHYVLNNYFLKEKLKSFPNKKKGVGQLAELEFFSVFFIMSVLIPTNLVAFRFANYDACSMLLGLTGIFLAIAGLHRKSVPLVLISLIFSSVASQEKLLAEPLALACLLIAVYLMYQQKRKLYLLPVYIIIGMFIFFLTTLLLTVLVGIAKDFKFISFTLFNITTPLISWAIPRKYVIEETGKLYLPVSTVLRYIITLGIAIFGATVIIDLV